MANKYRGEVDMPAFGPGVFVAYDLEDFAAIEEEFGLRFFDAIEPRVFNASIPTITKMLEIGLRQRGADGAVEKIGPGHDFRALFQSGYNFGDASLPIMNALAMSWLGKTHAELVDEALEAKKRDDAENLKRAKEAAEEAGIPFDEASLSGLSKLLTLMASESTGQSGG